VIAQGVAGEWKGGAQGEHVAEVGWGGSPQGAGRVGRATLVVVPVVIDPAGPIVVPTPGPPPSLGVVIGGKASEALEDHSQ